MKIILISPFRHLIIDNDREVKLNNKRDSKEREIEEKVEKVRKVETEKDRREKIREIKEEYLGLIFIDPFLPKEILPVNWAFGELTVLIKKL